MATAHGTGTPGTDPDRPDGAGTWLVNTALGAGVLFTANAEYRLARDLGAGTYVAALLPVAIDVYVIAAVRGGKGRDIATSLAIMGVAQIAAHLLESRQIAVSIPLISAVSLLVPLVIWRVHALRHKAHRPVPAPVPQPAPAPAPVDTQAVAEAVLERLPNPYGAAALPRILPVPVEVPVLPILEAVPLPRPVPALPAEHTRGPRVDIVVDAEVPPVPDSSAIEKAAAEHKVSVPQIRAVLGWLDEAKLSGAIVGERLGVSEGYGRRVLRAAKAVAK